ncbi:MAG: hypothetical protein CMN28_07400 [Salinisphaeraceae bacterium]|nr:hypothetical protein [Salinisphaeraceae bacterium]
MFLRLSRQDFSDTRSSDLLATLDNAARLVEQFDWQTTALGPADGWATAQRAAVNAALCAPSPAMVAWGQAQPLVCCANQAFLDGPFPRETLLGQPLAQLWFDQNTRLQAEVDEILAGQPCEQGEFITPAEGNPERAPRFFRYTLTPLFADGLAPAGVRVDFHEVTDSVRNAQQLAERRQQFRFLLEATAQSFWEANGEGQIESDSDTWLKLTGQTPPDMLGVGWLDALHPEDQVRVRQLWDRSVATGQPYDAEYRLVHPDGATHWSRARAVAIRDRDGAVLKWMGMNVDIDGRKRVELQLERALAEKEKFISILSHELRNPLSALTAALRHVEVRHTSLALGSDHVLMRRQVEHLTRLVDDLMETAYVSLPNFRLKPQVVELEQVLNTAICDALHLYDERGCELRIDISEQPMPTWADPIRLHQVFLNLLGNAVRFCTPKRGQVRLTAYPRGEQLQVSIEDNGCGIAPDDQPRIFEFFYRGANSHDGGLGIGLALSRQLVEAHDGHISVYSAGRGAGARFDVQLDRQAPRQSEAADEGPGSAARTAPPMRVLLVEDNSSVAQAMVSVLEIMGHRVRWVGDGEAALGLFPRFEPEAVILDIGLPDISGLEVARRIRQLPRGEAVLLIALSGWGRTEDREQGRAAGVDHYLTKPVAFDHIESLLRAARSPVPRRRRARL